MKTTATITTNGKNDRFGDLGVVGCVLTFTPVLEIHTPSGAADNKIKTIINLFLIKRFSIHFHNGVKG